MELSEFELLLQKILHDTATPEEQAYLQQCLHESEELRQLYCQHTRLEALLTMRSQGIKALLSPTPVIPLEVMQKSQNKKMVRWMTASTIAALLMIGIFLTIFLTPQSSGLDFETSPNSAFTLTHDKKSLENQNKMKKGSTLTLTSGSVALKFGSGVTSIIEAPAKLTLLKNDHLRLDHGKAWFEVPSKAVGFKVTTPEFEVIDLGTEFGINSTPNLEDECHVFKGKVKLTALKGLKASAILKAGNASKTTVAGRIKPIKLNELAYLKSLPVKPLHLHWTFDTIKDGKFTTESSYKNLSLTQNTLHSKQTVAQAQTNGKYGKALRFAEMGDHLNTDWQGISGSQARTVAFWIKPSSEGKQGLTSLLGWGKRGGTLDQGCFLLFSRNSGNKITFGLAARGIELESPKQLPVNQWTHFTCVYHGKLDENRQPHFTFYFNGEVAPHSYKNLNKGNPEPRVNTITNHFQSVPLSIGSSLHSNPNYDFPKKTALDELHVISRALSSEEIQFLFLNNKLQ